MKPFEMTEEFHQTFDPRRPKKPTPFTNEEAVKRASFKVEELVEFLYAASQGKPEVFQQSTQQLHQAIDQAMTKVLAKNTSVDPLVDQVDALMDLLYFTYGSFSLLGVNPEPIMAIVHQANMGKLFPDGKPHYDPVTNKVLKPDNWARDFAPESKIKAELAKQSQQSD
uniref:HAD family hydrolase n=1 Tax=Candidatus Enterococcus willemsii TaxID=1857215 RepID=UPI00403FA4F1